MWYEGSCRENIYNDYYCPTIVSTAKESYSCFGTIKWITVSENQCQRS